MTERTQKLMMKTPIKSLQVANIEIADDARANRPGMRWSLDLERAKLLTESYKQSEGKPMVLRRAWGLRYILENMTIYLRPEELIVGNFASTPDSVVHYPEFAYKWVERETAPGQIYSDMLTEEEREELIEIDKYWENLSIHHLFKNIIPKDLYNEFYVFNWESATPNFEKLFQIGLKGVIQEAEERLQRLENEWLDGNNNGEEYVHKKQFLQSVIITIEGAINWAKRYANLARKEAGSIGDAMRKYELEEIAKICEWVPENPPRTLQEALQFYWFIHLIINFIDVPMVGDGIRFDVCFNPYFENDLKNNQITREETQELVECIFVKSQETGFLHPPIWSGAGGGAIGFQTITIGGINSEGQDVTNEMTYIVLDAMNSVRTVTPPLALRWNNKIPKKLIEKAIDVISTGMPQPAFFNDNVIITRLVSFGVPLEDAQNYSINNCMVPTIPGKNFNHRSAWATAIPVPQELTKTLKNIGETATSVEELIEDFTENYKFRIKKLVFLSNIADCFYKEYVPRPFLSALHDDAIERAQDVREWNYALDYRDVVILGLNNVADSFAAIKKLVFEEKKVTMSELIDALRKNWRGKYKDLRKLFIDAPKFGNDDDYVDSISRRLGKMIMEETMKCKTNLGTPCIPDGTVASAFWFLGKGCEATPDGRKARETLHDGSISPVGGRDKKGPTAVLKSVSKVDPLISWNHLLNQSFMPQYLKGHNAEVFAQYLKTWADLGIHHIQFNAVGKEVLEDAQKNPEKYFNLMVRVAGYSAYFVDLSKDLQDSIIARTPQCF
ncbi:MAG: pyruvate formate lyase family protein [Candidatus Hermodarchaeota archaeon]